MQGDGAQASGWRNVAMRVDYSNKLSILDAFFTFNTYAGGEHIDCATYPIYLLQLSEWRRMC